jgi:hypothetical protein
MWYGPGELVAQAASWPEGLNPQEILAAKANG